MDARDVGPRAADLKAAVCPEMTRLVALLVVLSASDIAPLPRLYTGTATDRKHLPLDGQCVP